MKHSSLEENVKENLPCVGQQSPCGEPSKLDQRSTMLLAPLPQKRVEQSIPKEVTHDPEGFHTVFLLQVPVTPSHPLREYSQECSGTESPY